MTADQGSPPLGERLLRRIERFLDEADEALGTKNWAPVRENAEAVLAIDPENADARVLLAAAGRALSGSQGLGSGVRETDPQRATLSPQTPTSFVEGRYEVQRLLGEGGQEARLPGP